MKAAANDANQSRTILDSVLQCALASFWVSRIMSSFWTSLPSTEKNIS